MIKIFLLCGFLGLNALAFAQKTRAEKRAARDTKVNALVKQNEEGLVVFKKHYNYGGYLSTEGYHLFFEKGVRDSRRITKLYKVELSEKRHPREDRSINGSVLGAGNSLIFAKLNNVYQLSLGYGVQYLIGSKGNKNGIEISAVGTGGLVINLQKPYYYDVESATGVRKRIVFNTDTGGIFKISGASGFSYGWNELKINPGAFARTGLRFEYGSDNERVNAIEAGLQTEFFAKKVPQVFGLKERQFFIGAYVGIVFGRRK